MFCLILVLSYCGCFDPASKQKEMLWRKVSESRLKYKNSSYSEHLWLSNLVHDLVSEQECDSEQEEVMERLVVGVGA